MSSPTLIVRDESLSGSVQQELSLSFLTERITVRELIRERVYQEVREYNAAPPRDYQGLVQPTEIEKSLNNRTTPAKPSMNWEAQYTKALEAFTDNKFFILVDNKQVDGLDEMVVISPTTIVSFIKLIPLVGG